MKNALKSIFHFKFLVILIIIQFSVGIYLLNTSSITKKEAQLKKQNIDRLFNIDSTYFLTVELSPKSEEIQNPFSLAEAPYQELEKLKEEGIIKDIYFSYGDGVNAISAHNGIVPEKYKNTAGRNLAMMMVNESFYNNYGLNISKGRGFEKDDFYVNGITENIPIILGEDYIDLVEIGDVFESGFPDLSTTEYKGFDVNFEVVGFYKHNDIPLLGGHASTISSDIVYSDGFGIFPLVNDIIAINYQPRIISYGTFIDVGNKENINTILDRLSSTIQSPYSSISYMDISYNFNSVKNALTKNVFNANLLGISLTLLSLIGVDAIMYGRIEERKKEFGIKISCGATKKTIILEILLENLFLCILSTLFALISIKINYPNLLTLKMVLGNLSLTLIMVIFISILPILKFKKLNIIDALRR
ncbi:MAG: ABC transporter permease [Sarcina sp.]